VTDSAAPDIDRATREPIRPTPRLWTWSLPSWMTTDLAAYQLYGRLWSHVRPELHRSDQPKRVLDQVREQVPEQIEVAAMVGGWAWIGRFEVDQPSGSTSNMAAAVYRPQAFDNGESPALGQALKTVASALTTLDRPAADDVGDGFAGGRCGWVIRLPRPAGLTVRSWPWPAPHQPH